MSFHSPLMLAFSPRQLFGASEQGVWYDPSDLSSMWQDAQGTTAVTGVEQAVGLILDRREGRGLGTELVTNNTFATDTDWTKGTGWSIGSGVATKTAGSASVLSQAVSLTAGHTYRLVYTITRSAGSITPQFTGGSTVSGTAQSASGTYVQILTAVSGNTTLEFSANASFAGAVDNVYLKRTSGNDAWQLTSASRPVLSARYNLLLATATLSTQNVTTVATTYTLTFSGAGSITLSGTATGSYSAGSHSISCTAGTLTLTVTGTITNADFRVANDGNGLPAYQRVTTATDYDTAGFPLYLRFDGTDDSLVTGNLDFTARDEMSVFAGVRKIGALTAVLVELSAAIASNNGAFVILAPVNDAPNDDYRLNSKGTTLQSATSTLLRAPVTNVLAGSSDISADTVRLRINGVVNGFSGLDQGTGNFGNHPLYIGSRGGSSLRFNGRLYSLIVRGATSTTGQITDTEGWINGRTRAYA